MYLCLDLYGGVGEEGCVCTFDATQPRVGPKHRPGDATEEREDLLGEGPREKGYGGFLSPARGGSDP